MEDFLYRVTELFDPETVEAIEGPFSLYGGFIVGLIFGIVIQKARMCKYDVVSGLFRLQDFTIFRVGTPLLIAATVLIYFFKDMGVVELHVPATKIVPQIIGGLIFGAAIAILGYCPGTAAGALGEGTLDAIPGIMGMITGAVIYAEFFHDAWQDTFLKIGYLGRITLPDVFGVNHWFVIIPFVLMLIMFLTATTMVDWMLILFRRVFNYFMDFTDALEDRIQRFK